MCIKFSVIDLVASPQQKPSFILAHDASGYTVLYQHTINSSLVCMTGGRFEVLLNSEINTCRLDSRNMSPVFLTYTH